MNRLRLWLNAPKEALIKLLKLRERKIELIGKILSISEPTQITGKIALGVEPGCNCKECGCNDKN